MEEPLYRNAVDLQFIFSVRRMGIFNSTSGMHHQPTAFIPGFTITICVGTAMRTIRFQSNSSPGTRAVVLDPANIRTTWATHGTEGYYVGPALNHYRCFTFSMPQTRSLRISDTVQWLPKNRHITLPSSTQLILAQFSELLPLFTRAISSLMVRECPVLKRVHHKFHPIVRG